jgi:DNA mismatch repair protein MutL
LEREVLVKEVKWDRKPREKVSFKVEDSARDDSAVDAAAESAKKPAEFFNNPAVSSPSLFDREEILPGYAPREQTDEIKSGAKTEREIKYGYESGDKAEAEPKLKTEPGIKPILGLIPENEPMLKFEPELKNKTELRLKPIPEPNPEPNPEPTPKEFFTDYKIVGQLFKTYWVVEQNDKMYVIDQHAAHERVLYEEYLAKFEAGGVSSQILLMPEKIKLTPVEAETVKENLELLTRFGFEIEEFTPDIFLLRALPVIFSKPVKPDFIIEIIDSLAGFTAAQANLKDIKSSAVASISCKAAVKANENLSEYECESLIKQLLKLENPFNCPHGRPTIISMTRYEIEKKFGRK